MNTKGISIILIGTAVVLCSTILSAGIVVRNPADTFTIPFQGGVIVGTPGDTYQLPMGSEAPSSADLPQGYVDSGDLAHLIAGNTQSNGNINLDDLAMVLDYIGQPRADLVYASLQPQSFRK